MVQANLIHNIQPSTLSMQSEKRQLVSAGEAQSAFAANLKNAIHKLNESQIESDLKTEALANGKIDDLHDVMITAQKASLSMTTAIEIQKKAIDAYTEMMRMQV